VFWYLKYEEHWSMDSAEKTIFYMLGEKREAKTVSNVGEFVQAVDVYSKANERWKTTSMLRKAAVTSEQIRQSFFRALTLGCLREKIRQNVPRFTLTCRVSGRTNRRDKFAKWLDISSPTTCTSVTCCKVSRGNLLATFNLMQMEQPSCSKRAGIFWNSLSKWRI